MSNAFLLVPIFLPIICGGIYLVADIKSEKLSRIFLMSAVMLTSLSTYCLIFLTSDTLFPLFTFIGDISISLNLDGMGKIFAGLAALLWPFTTLYAFEYMKHEQHTKMFYGFFLVAFGITLGIACAGNFLTMYFFYELLTLSTLPLVLQPMTRESRRAGLSYLLYSIGGAAFAFIAMVFIITYGSSGSFQMGGVLTAKALEKKDLLLAVYVAGFLGFGVKSAIFPLHSWLPKASVAPTPVTALLHAVAVVKAGAFAIIRLSYYCFGADFLRDTWAQYTVMAFTLFTILYGSSAALKQVHFKRRLAYSTVANLSYILFGISLFTPAGLQAGVLHMLFHSLIKICAFFAAGAVLHSAGKQYITALDGIGRKMPITFSCFTVAALSLTGIPLFNGFVSKWALAEAAIESGNSLAYWGIAVLLISALLTAVYMLGVSIRAFFPQKGHEAAVAKVHEASPLMTVPMLILALACVLLGLCSQPVINLISTALRFS